MDSNQMYHWGIKGMRWGVRRFQNKDGTRTALGKKRERESAHEDYTKAHDNKSVKYMSNKELLDRNRRLQQEKQYRELTRKTSKGKKVVQTLITTAGTIAAAEGAYKTYKKIADRAIDGIGTMVLKDIGRGLSKGF